MESLQIDLQKWLLQMNVAHEYIAPIIKIGGILVILLITVIINRVCKKILIPIARKITAKTDSFWDDHLLSDDVLANICKLVPPIVIYILIPLILHQEPTIVALVLKACWIYITIVGVKLILAFISSIYTISSKYEKYKGHSLKGVYQMIKLLIVCIGAIIIISTLIDKSPIAILTGLGAGTAILMLVFQDTIKGLVAGIQLMANDMLRPGDWITVPKYGADGEVIEVTLTTIKVRNWDMTITTVPPYALVNDSFQNWRGMFDVGGRRIKRSINIDMHSVRFCTPDELEQFKKQPWMEGFEATGKEEVNLYIFRHYVDHYISNHPKVNKDMTILVRQLQPSAQGMPIELYFFSANTAWLNYENLQSEVFDHILAMLHIFDLKIFQSPTGMDFQRITQA